MTDPKELNPDRQVGGVLTSTLMDLERSIVQTGGDAGLLRELCSVLASDIPHYMEEASLAFESDDLAAVQVHMRSLRAACATVGASQVNAIAMLVEAHAKADDLHGARCKFEQLKGLASVLATELSQWSVRK